MKTIIYHNNCNDGFCAAWLLWRLFPDSRFVPMDYGGDFMPYMYQGQDVIIADFSFKRDIMLELKRYANSLIVLDHHKTAEAELQGLDFCKFDTTKSGARLVYEKFFPGAGMNWFVDYTEDRDLWKWKLPVSKEINAAISSYPREFEVWEKLAERNFTTLATEGEAILRYQDQVVKSHLKPIMRKIGNYYVPCVNATTQFSDIAGELAKDHSFGVCWFQRQDHKFQFSLRSRSDGVDVSAIAKEYGGGGHRNAAGFELDKLPW
jgi:oligoribonuclease NrnB/cAMP/cGMP phosphodiesterase (DHH superfamily)